MGGGYYALLLSRAFGSSNRYSSILNDVCLGYCFKGCSLQVSAMAHSSKLPINLSSPDFGCSLFCVVSENGMKNEPPFPSSCCVIFLTLKKCLF